MRKALLAVALIILLIFSILILVNGLHLGNIDVWGINEISVKNDEIDSQNAKLTSLIDTNYETSISKLKTSSETLQETKKQYEEKAIVLSQNKYYKQKDQYKHEFILVKIGKYADGNNVDIRLIVTESATSGLYDLNFTVTGKYADVASFIHDIENDSSLEFNIENFVEVSATATATREDGTTYTTNAVKANFYCREISIDLKWLDENETVIPGIITRGNPFITNSTKLTGKYKNERLDTSRSSGTNTNTSTDENTTNTNTNTAGGNTTDGNVSGGNTAAGNTTDGNTAGTNTTEQNTTQGNVVDSYTQ